MQISRTVLYAIAATVSVWQLPGTATAADIGTVESGYSLDLAFGAALTSDYVSRGITNSDSSPAVQGYIEPSYGPLYINIWSSNVDYGAGFKGAEIDTAFGFRPEFGAISTDFGYVHYFYAPKDTSPDYGEFYAKVKYNFDDKFTIGGNMYFAPDYNQSGKTGTYIEGKLSVPLPKGFELSGGIGYQFFQDPNAYEQLAWNAGASFNWKMLTMDLRYWDTNLSGSQCVVRSGFADGCDARVVGTVSFDTSWSDLSKATSQ
jgi:uncharacterized protein (TIGR02001 family)